MMLVPRGLLCQGCSIQCFPAYDDEENEEIYWVAIVGYNY